MTKVHAAVVSGPDAGLDQVSRLRVVVMRVARRIRQQGHEGITPSQLAVMGSLGRCGPMTLGEIAAAERVRPPSITRIVTALEQQGLVHRVSVAGDRRSSRVNMTPKARRLMQSIRGERNAWLSQRLRQLSSREQADLELGLDALEKILEHSE